MSANLQADKLLPYYKKMYQLAAEYSLDINRKFWEKSAAILIFAPKLTRSVIAHLFNDLFSTLHPFAIYEASNNQVILDLSKFG